MKPTSLCLIHMGQKGLELVKAHPDVLPTEETDKIVFQSIPFGSNDGDFVTRTVSNSVICGYVFSLPKIGDERSNIATLTAVYDSMEFEPQYIKKVFTLIVKELQKNAILSIELIQEILPKIYEGLVKGSFKIKVSSVVTLEFETEEDEKPKKQPLGGFSKDVW